MGDTLVCRSEYHHQMLMSSDMQGGPLVCMAGKPKLYILVRKKRVKEGKCKGAGGEKGTLWKTFDLKAYPEKLKDVILRSKVGPNVILVTEANPNLKEKCVPRSQCKWTLLRTGLLHLQGALEDPGAPASDSK